jgi:predicted hotdog family 3-hydroxylacyl-ACP dehydratase
VSEAPAAGPVADLVPHSGPMCLLGEIVDWSDERLRCTAAISDSHPLAIDGRLPATALIEYAAQAMAAHGRLVAGAATARPRPGMLVGIRSTTLARRWVDARQLAITVERRSGDEVNVLYDFVVGEAAGPVLASGRAIVVLERAATEAG